MSLPTLSKKSVYECKQHPAAYQKNIKKHPISKMFPFVAGVVDTGD
jgi:hypothetical protein